MQYFLSKKCSHLSPFASRLITFRLSPLTSHLSPHHLSPFTFHLSPFTFVGYSAQKTVYHSEVLK